MTAMSLVIRPMAAGFSKLVRRCNGRSSAAVRPRFRTAPNSPARPDAARARGRGISRLGVRPIRAGGLAERGRIADHVEDVIADLKSQADALGIMIELFQQARLDLRLTERSQQYAGADQRAGFVNVHVLQLGQGQFLADRRQIDGLTAHHAARARRLRQHPQHPQADRGSLGHALVLAEHLESQRLQGIAGQDRQRFAAGFMAARPTVAQIVVVHGRQVVVDQGIGMDELHRAGGAVQGFQGRPDRRAGRVDQHRADALAAAQHGVAHGLMQRAGMQVGARQSGVEGSFGAGLVVLDDGFDHARQPAVSSNGTISNTPSRSDKRETVRSAA